MWLRLVGEVLKHLGRAALARAIAIALVACDKPKAPEPAPPSPAPAQTASEAPKATSKLAVARPAPERVVAIGDLHGDLEAVRKAFRLAGAVDDKDKWIGGKLVVVQTGDLVDRGDDDRAILDLTERWKGEATAAGGELVELVGNHELMNAELDFRYVTRGSFTSFASVSPKDEATAAEVAQVDAPGRGRAAAFLPGGPYAKILATRPVVARVGDSIFVHGGVLPKYVRDLDAINESARTWLLGETRTLHKGLKAEDGPLWSRLYSAAPGKEDCAQLTEALRLLNAKRMVMGHTVQKPGIGAACEERAWRIDVGASKGMTPEGRAAEVLEIRGDVVKVLKEGR